jgi:3,4-dihydroxy 2-butanone 4-phosphate synthase/GTP cyclohydrolase II
MDRHPGLSSIEEVIDDARNGRMFILVDDEDRENEGDLVIPAQMATPDAVNFMATHGRGLICLAMPRERIEGLGLPMMATENLSRHQTAFTVSIEARQGVTTGISARDRARTISVAVDPTKGPDDIAVPGHIFPLMARDGGVLVRAGHTEAAVDVARLAGLVPAGVICEVMNDDGTMARLPDLITFAQRHNLKVATIADLIAYRRRHDSLVECISETRVDSIHGGDWQMRIYANKAEYAEHVVLIKGDIRGDGPVPVRMHLLDMFSDIVGDVTAKPGQLQSAMRKIGEMGRGVVVILTRIQPTVLSRAVAARSVQSGTPSSRLLDYGIGAQILLDVGVKDMILLSNTHHTIVGLEGYGLSVVDQLPLEVETADG